MLRVLCLFLFVFVAYRHGYKKLSLNINQVLAERPLCIACTFLPPTISDPALNNIRPADLKN